MSRNSDTMAGCMVILVIVILGLMLAGVLLNGGIDTGTGSVL